MRSPKTTLTYRHVDVFSHTPLSGNGLTVFLDCGGLTTEIMQKIAQEMRQFESIFISSTEEPQTFRARIFTMEEELNFAGHPVLGAACVLHEQLNHSEQPNHSEQQQWKLQLNAKTVHVITSKQEGGYRATMDQGTPAFELPISSQNQHLLLSALNLSDQDLPESLPLQVISTGLPYLIVPIQRGLERASISNPQFEQMLTDINAKFVYVLDVSTLEGRTWDNNGRVEDVATGSAAGPAGAYLVKYGIVQPETDMTLHQGKFVGRPSRIMFKVRGTADEIRSVEVSGEVCMVAQGSLDDDFR